MTRDEIQTRIIDLMVETFELDPDQVKPESNLYTDLELDSIDALDMVVKLQDLTQRRVAEDLEIHGRHHFRIRENHNRPRQVTHWLNENVMRLAQVSRSQVILGTSQDHRLESITVLQHLEEIVEERTAFVGVEHGIT